MRPEELDHALQPGNHTPTPASPPPYSPLGSAVAVSMEHARNVAQGWGLIRPDGSIKCLYDWCGNTTTDPSLMCPVCKERRGGR